MRSMIEKIEFSEKKYCDAVLSREAHNLTNSEEYQNKYMKGKKLNINFI